MAKQAPTRYLSNDAKEFATEAEADARNMFLKVQDSIDAYIAESRLEKAQAGLMRKHIPGYLAFAERGAVELAASATGDVLPGDDTGDGATGGDA